MFNPEKLLEQRIDRVKFFMKTDTLPFKYRRYFVTQNLFLIMNTYYGNRFKAIFAINWFFIKECFADISAALYFLWLQKIRRKSNKEIEAMFLSKGSKNEKDD